MAELREQSGPMLVSASSTVGEATAGTVEPQKAAASETHRSRVPPDSVLKSPYRRLRQSWVDGPSTSPAPSPSWSNFKVHFSFLRGPKIADLATDPRNCLVRLIIAIVYTPSAKIA